MFERKRGYVGVLDRKRIRARDYGQRQACKRAGRMILAPAVDHIVKLRWPGAKTDHPSSLEAICDPCHAVKTGAEQGRRKRTKRAAWPHGWQV